MFLTDKKHPWVSRKISLKMIFLCSILVLTAACQQGADREGAIEQMMDEALANRINRYKKARANRCKEGLVNEANRIVDSILQYEIKMATDTIEKPPKPLKPAGKEKKVLEDTTPVQPFLKKY